MKYAKPELRTLTNALEAVQGRKDAPVQMDSAPPNHINVSANAYEADE